MTGSHIHKNPLEAFTLPGRLLVIASIIVAGGILYWNITYITDYFPSGSYPFAFLLIPSVIGAFVFFGIGSLILHFSGVRIRRIPERESFHRAMRAISPEEATCVVRREAASRFGIKDDQFNLPLVGALGFAPAEVIGFIEDLETGYGFSLADKVSPSTASVQDLIGVLSRQKTEESNRIPVDGDSP